MKQIALVVGFLLLMVFGLESDQFYSLQELLNPDLLTCEHRQSQFDAAIMDLTKWLDLVVHQKELMQDLKTLGVVRDLIGRAKSSILRDQSNTINNSSNTVDPKVSIRMTQFGEKISQGLQSMKLAQIQSKWVQDPLTDILDKMRQFQLVEQNTQRARLADTILDEISKLMYSMQRDLDCLLAYPVEANELEQRIKELCNQKNLCLPISQQQIHDLQRQRQIEASRVSQGREQEQPIQRPFRQPIQPLVTNVDPIVEEIGESQQQDLQGQMQSISSKSNDDVVVGTQKIHSFAPEEKLLIIKSIEPEPDIQRIYSIEPDTNKNIQSIEPDNYLDIQSIEPDTNKNIQSFEPDTNKIIQSIEPETNINIQSIEPDDYYMNIKSVEPDNFKDSQLEGTILNEQYKSERVNRMQQQRQQERLEQDMKEVVFHVREIDVVDEQIDDECQEKVQSDLGQDIRNMQFSRQAQKVVDYHLSEKERELAQREQNLQEREEALRQQDALQNKIVRSIEQQGKESEESEEKQEEQSEDKTSDEKIDPKDIDPILYDSKRYPKTTASDSVTHVHNRTLIVESRETGATSIDQIFDDLEDPTEYGYGMWLRQDQEENEGRGDYTFLSRLTSNEDYQDFSRYGDRTLALFLLDDVFVFVTYDFSTLQRNIYKNTIQVDKNYQGMWYFIMFSYDQQQQKAVGFIKKYGKQQIATIEIKATHIPPSYFRIIVGGQHLHYKGFNGQIANFFISIGPHSFIHNEHMLLQTIQQSSHQPQSLFTQLKIEVIRDIQTIVPSTTRTDDTTLILDEYAVSGWFRWENTIESDPVAFRLFNLRSHESDFGSRALEVDYIVSKNNLVYSTYSTMGIGSTCICHYTEPLQFLWTFVYFGYSYDKAKAYALMIQPQAYSQKSFNGIQHLLTQRLEFMLGGDDRLASFTGRGAYFSLYLGPQSFREGLVFGDSFGYGHGATALYQQLRPLVRSDEQQGEPELVRPIEWSQKEPAYEVLIVHDDRNQRINGQGEYGFGLWSRWVRSTPKFLEQRSRIHNIAVLGVDIKQNIVEHSSIEETPNEEVIQISQQEEQHSSSEEGGIIVQSEEDIGTQYSEEHIVDTIISEEEEIDRQLYLREFGIFQQQKQTMYSPKASALKVQVAVGSYVFSTYTNVPFLEDGLTENVLYGDELEGKWNYIYFSYRHGTALGYIVFEDHVSQVKFTVSHELIVRSVSLGVGQWGNGAPAFNGYMSQIQLRVGVGSHIANHAALLEFCGGTLPPSAVVQPVARRTLSLVDSVEFVQVFDGVKDYSVSGWAKWSGASMTGRTHNLILLAQRQLKEIRTGQEEGVHSLSISRTDTAYRFKTYTCHNEIKCLSDDSTVSDQPYGDAHTEYWNQWTFFYFGYSSDQRRAFGYLRFTFSEQQLDLTGTQHFYFSVASIILSNALPGYVEWKGTVKNWVVNVGEGSFKTEAWDQDETTRLNFGLKEGSDHLRLQSASQEVHRSEEVLQCDASDRNTIPLVTEFKHNQGLHMQGVSEYGYGFWSKFSYFANDTPMLVKPVWLGMARLTTNKQFSDQDNLGDRTLAIWMGKGFYQFATYNIQPWQPNVYGNINYIPEVEGHWVYLHFAYKRFSQSSGRGVGFMVFENAISTTEIQTLHFPLQEYMQLLVGSVGHFYPSFNGLITRIRFNLGPGAFIDSKEGVMLRTQNKDPIPLPLIVPTSTIQIVEDKEMFPRSNKQLNLLEYSNFTGVEAYSISLWFRQQNNQQQLIYRLTTTPPSSFSDSQKPGDRVLALITRQEGITFSTYTLLQGDAVQPLLAYSCPIEQSSQSSWIFTYFAYSREQQRVQYYSKVEDQEFKGNEKALHLTPRNLWLYLAQDRFLDGFQGRIAHMSLEMGAYRSDNFFGLQAYITGSAQFQDKHPFAWEERSDEVIQVGEEHIEFHDSPTFPIEGGTEYSVGFWCRYMTTLPQRRYRVPNFMYIIRLDNNEEQQGNSLLGVQLGFQQYVFQTQDQQNGNVQTRIRIDNEVEGVWRYLYFAYSKLRKQAIAFTLEFTLEYRCSQIDGIINHPVQDYLKLKIGDSVNKGFNGILTKLQLRFGSSITDPRVLAQLVGTALSLPIELTTQNYANYPRQDVDFNFTQSATEGGKYVNLNIGVNNGGQYSISGWIKYTYTSPISLLEIKQQGLEYKSLQVGDLEEEEELQVIQEEQEEQQVIQEEQIVSEELLVPEEQVVSVEVFAEELVAPEEQVVTEEQVVAEEEVSEEFEQQPESIENEQTELPENEQTISEESEQYFPKWRGAAGVTSQTNQECQLIFRVTENHGDYLNDRAAQGDRTLYAEFCGGERIRFSTYTLLALTDYNEAKHVEHRVELGEFTHSWIYVYMGYDELTREVSCLLKFPRHDETFILTGIQHFVADVVGVFVGRDVYRQPFEGVLQKWVFSFGQGAYIPVSREGYQDTLPNYNSIKTDVEYMWSQDEGTTPEFHEFQSEADSVMEYAVAVWTRWMTDIPTKLIQRSPIHTIFRLSTTHSQGDQSEMGNRALSTFLDEGSYLFSTYDLATNKAAVSMGVPYENRLEGQWNFIYMAHRVNDQKSVGMVLFSENQSVESITIPSQHKVLASYARISFGAREFGYTSFHGILFDPQVYFGPGGFFLTGQQMVDGILQRHRHPPVSPTAARDFAWQVPRIDTSSPTDIQNYSNDLHYMFNDYVDVGEYSFAAWVQPEVQSNSPSQFVDQVIMRLTTNDPEYQSNDDSAGDRALLILSNPSQQSYCTYSFDEPKHKSLMKQMPVYNNRYQWSFVYFGYSRQKKMAYGYTLFTTREEIVTFVEVRHVVPRVFHLYLIKDTSYTMFYGKLSSVKLHFGLGAFTKTPHDLIDSWPYNPQDIDKEEYPTDKLVNNGMNSARIIREKSIQPKIYTDSSITKSFIQIDIIKYQ